MRVNFDLWPHFHCDFLFAVYFQTEFELSAHDHGEDPPSLEKESLIPTAEPYEPPIIRKVPSKRMTTDQMTPNRHFQVRVLFQLSRSHIPAYGWKVRNVPSSAPIRDTSSEKTGMALATTYATMVIPNVEQSHVAQCVTLLAVRCSDPRKIRTKTCLADNYDTF